MRKPAQQAAFFRVLVDILHHLVSGNSHVGFMERGDWNAHYQKIHGLKVKTAWIPKPSPPIPLAVKRKGPRSPDSSPLCT